MSWQTCSSEKWTIASWSVITVKIVMEDGRSLDLTMDEARAPRFPTQRLHGYNGRRLTKKVTTDLPPGHGAYGAYVAFCTAFLGAVEVLPSADLRLSFLRTLRHRAAILKQQLSKAEASTLDDLVEVLETMAGSVDLC